MFLFTVVPSSPACWLNFAEQNTDMQVLVRDGRCVAVDADVDSTVADVKAAYMLKAFGTALPDALVSTSETHTI